VGCLSTLEKQAKKVSPETRIRQPSPRRFFGSFGTVLAGIASDIEAEALKASAQSANDSKR